MSDQMEFVYPKEIQEQSELAEKIHSQLFNTDTPKEEPEEEQLEEEPEEIVEEEDTYKKRYETLQGKYDAEVPRLAKELRDFKETYVNQQLAKLTPESPVVEEENPAILKFLEEYGDEFADQLRALIRVEAEKVAVDKIKPLEEQNQRYAKTQEDLARRELESYLDSHAKGWDALMEGTDPKFQEFLKQPDPSGLYTNGELFDLYNKSWNQEKLGTLFNMYLKGNEVAPPPPRQPNPSKDALVAPSRNQSNPPPNVDDKKVWTQGEIEQFQREDRTGKYSAEQSKLIWDDLLAAVSENRIR
jgi:hypothetical protein